MAAMMLKYESIQGRQIHIQTQKEICEICKQSSRIKNTDRASTNGRENVNRLITGIQTTDIYVKMVNVIKYA